jgi:flavin-binding protein dodecin
MAEDKDKEAGVYRIVDVIGVSTVSWEDATCGSLKSRKWT